AGEKHYLQNKVRAFRTGQPVPHGATSPSLPQGENIMVLLTLQREPLGGTTSLAGILLNAPQDLQDERVSRPTTRSPYRAQGKPRSAGRGPGAPGRRRAAAVRAPAPRRSPAGRSVQLRAGLEGPTHPPGLRPHGARARPAVRLAAGMPARGRPRRGGDDVAVA